MSQKWLENLKVLEKDADLRHEVNRLSGLLGKEMASVTPKTGTLFKMRKLVEDAPSIQIEGFVVEGLSIWLKPVNIM